MHLLLCRPPGRRSSSSSLRGACQQLLRTLPLLPPLADGQQPSPVSTTTTTSIMRLRRSPLDSFVITTRQL